MRPYAPVIDRAASSGTEEGEAGATELTWNTLELPIEGMSVTIGILLLTD
jgi:hypothetical protein